MAAALSIVMAFIGCCRYDIDWKEAAIVGNSEDATKTALQGASLVVCSAGWVASKIEPVLCRKALLYEASAGRS